MKLTNFGQALMNETPEEKIIKSGYLEIINDVRASLVFALLQQGVSLDHYVETEGMTLGEICKEAEITAEDLAKFHEDYQK